jgi:hypothetical protein
MPRNDNRGKARNDIGEMPCDDKEGGHVITEGLILPRKLFIMRCLGLLVYNKASLYNK